MGVQVEDLKPEEAQRLSVAGGAIIEGVFMRGPARNAGLAPGDILLKLDGRAVHGAGDIRDAVAEMEPGAKVKLTYRRKDETKTVEVLVGTQPKDWGVNKNQD
jgi:serine protease DegQ